MHRTISRTGRTGLAAAAAAALVLGGLPGARAQPQQEKPAAVKPAAKQEKTTAALPPNLALNPALKHPVATLETAKGTIKIELYPQEAPKTVQNFLALIGKGYYDGLVFHRVEPGFVIQGGDPNGDGTGGPGYTIPDEKNKKLKHGRGAVAMAKTPAPNSAGSQFYVVIEKPASFLDGKYTVFGQVIEGQEVAEKIAVGDRMVKVTAQVPSLEATAPGGASAASKETRAAEPVTLVPPTIPLIGQSKPLRRTAVKVKVTIEPDAKTKVELKESTGVKEMDNALLDALRQWKWTPALKDGKAVKSDQTFRYDILTGSRSYD
ncbi:MAG TPA: peptidylprolyl isomerase [Armatimonadaceae bacterium]|jgi:peptidyl-prolyl cis-trans isomerase B (cyclophilin B)|nr:peptidylprolyl isomerase [Armatimonadaceae bacterium]